MATNEEDKIIQTFEEFSEWANDRLQSHEELLKFAFYWMNRAMTAENYLSSQQYTNRKAVLLNEENMVLKEVIQNADLGHLIPLVESYQSVEQAEEEEKVIWSAINNISFEKADQIGAQQKTERSHIMNDKKHAKTREAKSFVLEDWTKKRNNFPGAAAAGRHYSELLAGEGTAVLPDTITRWIREHASNIGVKLS